MDTAEKAYVSSLVAGVTRIREFARVIRFRPFEQATEAGRGKERLRRVALTALTAAFSKLFSVLVPLVTIPLTLSYLGEERYGLWMAAVSANAMLVFADLGLGAGLLTAVSRALGRGETTAAASYVSNAFLVLFSVATVLALLLVIGGPYVPWHRLVNAPQSLSGEAHAVVAAVVIGMVVNLPLGAFTRTQAACQMGFQANLWQCLGSICSVIGIVVAVRQHAPLGLLVLIATLTPALPATANAVQFFFFQKPELRPRFRLLSRPIFGHLLKLGGAFLLLTVLQEMALSSDNLIIAHVLGLKQAASFSVPARIASMMVIVPQMIYLPLWAANGDAFARGDVAWVRRSTFTVIKYTFALMLGAGLMFTIMGRTLIGWWVGPALMPSYTLLAGLSLWGVVMATAGPLFMVLNGANRIRVQLAMYAVFLPTVIPLKIFLAKTMGSPGVVWATVLAYSTIILPAVWISVKRVLAEPHAVQMPPVSESTA